MTMQAEISSAKLQKKIGTTQIVMVDEITKEGITARSVADAPEIDGLVFIDDVFDANPGDLISVKITDANDHDLFAAKI